MKNFGKITVSFGLIISLVFLISCDGSSGGSKSGDEPQSPPSGEKSSATSNSKGELTLNFEKATYTFQLHNIYDPTSETLAGIKVTGYLDEGVVELHVEGNTNYLPSYDTYKANLLNNNQYVGMIPRAVTPNNYLVQKKYLDLSENLGEYIKTETGTDALEYIYSNYPETNAVLVLNEASYDNFGTTSFEIYKSHLPDTMVLVKENEQASLLLDMLRPQEARAVVSTIGVAVILGTPVVIASAVTTISQRLDEIKDDVAPDITLSSPVDDASLSEISNQNFTYQLNDINEYNRYGVFEFMVGTTPDLFNYNVESLVLKKIDRHAPMDTNLTTLQFEPEEFTSLEKGTTYYWGIRVTPYEGPSSQAVSSFTYTGNTTPTVSLEPMDYDKDNDGYTPNGGDCNDQNSEQNPAATEICGDLIDNDCSDGDLLCPQSTTNRAPRVVLDPYLTHIDPDEAVEVSCFSIDPEFDPINFTWYCSDGIIIDSSINDEHPWRVTWLAENLSDGIYEIGCVVYDGEDTSIGTTSITVGTPITCYDWDFDGYYSQHGCDTLIDCNDSDYSIHPTAPENCGDGVDNDCDGNIDSEDIECQRELSDISPASTLDLYGVWGTSNSNMFAVGARNTIFHYDGNSWSTMDNGTQYTGTLFDVWGNSGSDVFAVGAGGIILHYDGSSWSQMNSGTTYQLWGVWGSSSSNVFAVGHRGTILHYDGSSWSTMSGGSSYIYDVWGSSGTDVFAGGVNTNTTDECIIHYDGVSWSARNKVSTPVLEIWGISASDVFAVGDGIIHYDGSSWSSVYSGTSEQLWGVHGSSSSDVYAAGTNGILLHYNGSSWKEMNSNTTEFLTDVWVNNLDVFVVGGNGTVLHYGP